MSVCKVGTSHVTMYVEFRSTAIYFINVGNGVQALAAKQVGKAPIVSILTHFVAIFELGSNKLLIQFQL
jgi:hypothetical protein